MRIPFDLQGVGPATLNDLIKTELQAQCDKRGIYYAKSWSKGDLVDELLKWKRNPEAVSPSKGSTKKKRSREYSFSEDEDEEDCRTINKSSKRKRSAREIFSSDDESKDRSLALYEPNSFASVPAYKTLSFGGVYEHSTHDKIYVGQVTSGKHKDRSFEKRWQGGYGSHNPETHAIILKGKAKSKAVFGAVVIDDPDDIYTKRITNAVEKSRIERARSKNKKKVLNKTKGNSFKYKL